MAFLFRRSGVKRTKSTLLAPFCSVQVRCFGVRHKIVDIGDAVGLVRSGDSLACSGFVGQASPELLLRALGDRYKETEKPKNLTIIFGGGPGDWEHRGLNHLAHEGMLKRCIGAHYGQIPRIAELALANKVEAYNLPMGSVSRMIRCTAGAVPGHITKVGLGTFVDPRFGGGKINERTVDDLVELVTLDGQDYLRYKPVPPRVAFIRATTGDAFGNLSLERESLVGDVRNIALATRSAGGIVIAQVERVADTGTIPARSVVVPGALVDCVVVASPQEHEMSYFTQYNPAWSAEIRGPMDAEEPMQLNARKIIARRAAVELKRDDVVNLGIGMPEGVAMVSKEESIFPYLTLTTEPGVFGGVGASGVEFGPASNPDAFLEMNQQFDFYSGGGLNACFLGMAQISRKGDVNVSRLSESSLTGPGGFIDISQSTRVVHFLGTFTKKGLKTRCADGRLEILEEGAVRAFNEAVREMTFSAEQSLASGQTVKYITERAVFQLTSRGLRLTEVAPGVDLQRDVLDQMDFEPIVDPERVREMDPRLFREERMGLYDDLFAVDHIMLDRLFYKARTHTLFIDLSNLTLRDQEEIAQVKQVLEKKLKEVTGDGGNRVHVVVTYDGFDCRDSCINCWTDMVSELERKYYKGAAWRYTSKLFMRNKLGTKINMHSEDELWSSLTKGEDTLSAAQLREGLAMEHQLNVDPQDVVRFLDGKREITRDQFREVMHRLCEFEHKRH